jgi:hypothetical protein
MVIRNLRGGPTQPSRDTSDQDDLGNQKKDKGIGDSGFGPRGKGAPADVLSDDDRAAAAAAQEKALQAGLAPTNTIDSTGIQKGSFAVVAQGFDKYGARIQDKVDYTKPLEAPPAMIGPRGAGAPLDCWNGDNPEKP